MLTFLALFFLCLSPEYALSNPTTSVHHSIYEKRSASGASPSETKENKEAKYRDIRELFKVERREQLGHQIVAQIIEMSVQKILPAQREHFLNSVQKEFDFKELTEMLVPIYDQHFTHEEIKQIIRFYQTPTGQKLIHSQPKIMQDSTHVIQLWTQKATAQLEAVLKSLDQTPPPAPTPKSSVPAKAKK